MTVYKNETQPNVRTSWDSFICRQIILPISLGLQKSGRRGHGRGGNSHNFRNDKRSLTSYNFFRMRRF